MVNSELEEELLYIMDVVSMNEVGFNDATNSKVDFCVPPRTKVAETKT